jgi:hypothetical protein
VPFPPNRANRAKDFVWHVWHEWWHECRFRPTGSGLTQSIRAGNTRLESCVYFPSTLEPRVSRRFAIAAETLRSFTSSEPLTCADFAASVALPPLGVNGGMNAGNRPNRRLAGSAAHEDDADRGAAQRREMRRRPSLKGFSALV